MNTNVSASTEIKVDPRMKLIATRIKKENYKPDALIEILHTAQNAYGFLPKEVLVYIARALKLPPSRVLATVSFYHFFSLKSKGEHTCIICTGTACYVKGANQLLQKIEESFGLKPGQVSPDNKLGVQVARCIGACGLAPAVVMDNDVLGKIEAEELIRIVNEKIASV